MTSLSQSEAYYQPTNEQFQDSSKPNQEQPVFAFQPFDERSTVSSPPGGEAYTPTYVLEPQGTTLTTIATELRIKIYKYLFQTLATYLLRRRAGIEDQKVVEKLTNTFDCNILFTCRKLYEEALPICYASQTFHYSSNIGAYLSCNPHLMVNLSIDLKCTYYEDLDAKLSNIVAVYAQHCPKLRTLTIHLLLIEFYQSLAYRDFPATGNVLQNLYPRLDSLSIIALGSGPQEIVPRLRLSIADNKYWSDRCISHRPDSRGRSRLYTFQWPYLTLPSLVQQQVHRACSRSRVGPPWLNELGIYEWTCQREEVKEEVRLGLFSIADWVCGLEE